ncbi:unnamed protein product [Adineta ricciae]|uniref:G-protein coupled receptors family 1 profile domain-containing protein n=1 Tax=Adineta ricciae TaxID=249248 RepID=A0A814FDH1_ADIRI|nr:unnamed protein product [Adineta ricciae]CAF1416007.1 unnamed protein product [Adineta ricciae]
MSVESYVKASLIIGLFGLIAILSLVYLLTILLIPRFHNSNNFFIVNICFSTLVTSVYFMIFYTSYYITSRDIFTLNGCVRLYYIFNIASVAIPFAFVAFSVHRYCSIKYLNESLFQTKKWTATCIITQWVAVLMISLPSVFQKTDVCVNVLWLRIYTLITAVVLPSIVNITLNVLIFHHVRLSTRRVQPHTNQKMNFSRRDISLLRQMISMFIAFIGGWSGIYISIIITQFLKINEWIRPALVIFSDLSILAILINLFIHNHEVKSYLFDKIRRNFHH